MPKEDSDMLRDMAHNSQKNAEEIAMAAAMMDRNNPHAWTTAAAVKNIVREQGTDRCWNDDQIGTLKRQINGLEDRLNYHSWELQKTDRMLRAYEATFESLGQGLVDFGLPAERIAEVCNIFLLSFS